MTTPNSDRMFSPRMTPGPGRRHRKSILLTAPQTPKDVRQFDREEMIKYLQKYDPEMPDNLDLLMRASLQKRVIHCMKRRQNANSSPFPPAAAESAPIPWPQSAPPNQRFSRKRRADCPLTGALMEESPRHEEKEQDVDFSSLCRLSITPNDQDS